MPGIPHHVTQRGNNRQDVFFTDDDRRFYLESLSEQTERFGLAVLGYCLMTNHIHLLATPTVEDALAKAIGSTHLAYGEFRSVRQAAIAASPVACASPAATTYDLRGTPGRSHGPALITERDPYSSNSGGSQ